MPPHPPPSPPPSPPPDHRVERPSRRLPRAGWLQASTDQLVLVACAFWTLSANKAFLGAALSGRSGTDPATWGFGIALALGVYALHFLLLAPFATRRTVKPLLALLIVGTAFATHYMQRYGVYLDPSMLRNVLRTDLAEARELLSSALLPHLLLYAGAAAAAAVARAHRARGRWRARRAACGWRCSVLGGCGRSSARCWRVFQPLASLMRNHKEVRYLITPANYLWSLGAVAAARRAGAAKPRQAHRRWTPAGPGASWARRSSRWSWCWSSARPRARPTGASAATRARRRRELARPAGRSTSPRSGSCGTNTETSLPCMFAPVGRRDYDEARIRGSESLLHVAARAGVGVHWRDNQSRLQGRLRRPAAATTVADAQPAGPVRRRPLPRRGPAGRPRTSAWRTAAAARSCWCCTCSATTGRRTSAAIRRPSRASSRPARTTTCSRAARQQIVNAYDNALLYTDHVLAGADRPAAGAHAATSTRR